MNHQKNSYIGKIGQTIQPVLHLLEFNWKMSVSSLTGMAAKAVVVNTLSVLYIGDDEASQVLSTHIKQDLDEEGKPV